MVQVNTFDTQLTKAQRSLVREAVIAKLAPLRIANGKYIAAIGALPRPLRGEDDDAGWAMITMATGGASPAILVALGNAKYEPFDTEALEVVSVLEIAIYIVTANKRGLVDGRLASDVVATASALADPGVETALEHIQELLLGQDLGINTVYELHLETESEVSTGVDDSAWEQRYSVRMQRAINPDRLITELMTEIESGNELDDVTPALITTITPIAPPEAP